jgi:hypothetical protein
MSKDQTKTEETRVNGVRNARDVQERNDEPIKNRWKSIFATPKTDVRGIIEDWIWTEG